MRLIGSRSPMQKSVGGSSQSDATAVHDTDLTLELRSRVWPSLVEDQFVARLHPTSRCYATAPLGTDCLTLSQHGHLGWRGRLNGRAYSESSTRVRIRQAQADLEPGQCSNVNSVSVSLFIARSRLPARCEAQDLRNLPQLILASTVELLIAGARPPSEDPCLAE